MSRRSVSAAVAVALVLLLAGTSSAAEVLEEGTEGCPCGPPACVCPTVASPCKVGDPCYVEPEIACSGPSCSVAAPSVSQEPVVAKVVRHVTGDDAVVVMPRSAAEPQKSNGDQAAKPAPERKQNHKHEHRSEAPSQLADVGSSAPKPADTRVAVKAAAEAAAAAVGAKMESRLNEESAKIAELKKSLAEANRISANAAAAAAVAAASSASKTVSSPAAAPAAKASPEAKAKQPEKSAAAAVAAKKNTTAPEAKVAKADPVVAKALEAAKEAAKVSATSAAAAPAASESSAAASNATKSKTEAPKTQAEAAKAELKQQQASQQAAQKAVERPVAASSNATAAAQNVSVTSGGAAAASSSASSSASAAVASNATAANNATAGGSASSASTSASAASAASSSGQAAPAPSNATSSNGTVQNAATAAAVAKAKAQDAVAAAASTKQAPPMETKKNATSPPSESKLATADAIAAAEAKVPEDPRTTEAIRAAKAAEAAATQALDVSKAAKDAIEKQSTAYKAEAELRKAEVAASKAQADVMREKIEIMANSTSARQIAELQATVKALKKVQEEAPARAVTRDEKKLAAEEKAAAKVAAQVDDSAAKTSKILSQLPEDKKTSDAAAIKAAADKAAEAVASEKAAEEKAKTLDKKAILAAEVQEQGQKEEKQEASSAEIKAKQANDDSKLDQSQAAALLKQIEALKAQLDADKARKVAQDSKADADAKAAESSQKSVLQQLLVQEEDKKKREKATAEETEKSAARSEETKKAKELEALKAEQDSQARKAAADLLVQQAAEKARQAEEQSAKKAAKTAADEAALKEQSKTAAKAEEDSKAEIQKKQDDAVAEQKRQMAALQASLEEQKAKMMAQMAASAELMTKQLAAAKKQADQAEQDTKAKFQKDEQDQKAKAAQAKQEEEAEKAKIKGKQEETEKAAAKLAEKAKAEEAKAKQDAADEQVAKKKAADAKQEQTDKTNAARAQAEKDLAAARARLAEAAQKQAAEAAQKVADAKKAKEEADAKAKAEEEKTKTAAAVAAKEAAEKKVKEEKEKAEAKLEAERKAKEERAKQLDGLLTLNSGGRPLGEGWEDPSYSVDTDLCVLNGVGYWPEVRTNNLANVPEYCRPAKRLMYAGQMSSVKADSRIDLLPDGKVSMEQTQLPLGEPASWVSFAGMVVVKSTATLKPFPRDVSDPRYASKIFRNGYETLSYFKQGGLCVLHGTLSVSYGGDGYLIHVPDECIPTDGDLVFRVAAGDDNDAMVALQKGTGLLRYWAGTGSKTQWISLTGINYFVNNGDKNLELERSMSNLGGAPRKISYSRQGRLCALSGSFRMNVNKVEGLVTRLPEDCRPPIKTTFNVNGGRYRTERIVVEPTGEVTVHHESSSAAGNDVALDGVIFVVDAARFSKPDVHKVQQYDLAFDKQYAAFGGEYRKPSISVVSGKLVVLSGMITKTHKGTETDLVATLPEAALPQGSLMFTLDNGRRWEEAQVDIELVKGTDKEPSTATVRWPAGKDQKSSEWLSLDGIIYPNSNAKRLPLNINSNFRKEPGDNFVAPSVVLVDELCVMQGRAQSLHTGSSQPNEHMGYLPEECWPKDGRMEFQIAQGISGAARFDTYQDGRFYRYMRRTTTSRTLSFDGLVWPTKAFKLLNTAGNWVPYSDYRRMNYLLQDGLCVLSGSAIGTNHNWPVLYLPVECRPSARMSFSVVFNSGAARMDILPDGRLFLITHRNVRDLVHINGIFFVPDPKPAPPVKDLAVVQAKTVVLSKVKGAFAENVDDYGSGLAPATYSLMGSVCQLGGRIRSGGMGRVLITLPEECRPSGDLFFSTSNDNVKVGAILVNKAGELSVAFGADEFGDSLDLSSVIFPVAGVQARDLQLEGVWVPDPSPTAVAPSFVRVGDLCVLQGTISPIFGGASEIKAATNNGIQFVFLPVECRPRRRMILNLLAGDRVFRADILPSNGQISYDTANWDVSVPWISLSGVRLMANGDEGTHLTMVNGWRAYSDQHVQSVIDHRGDGYYRYPAYNKQGNLCLLTGLLYNGDTTGQLGKEVATLPASCRPTKKVTFWGNSHLQLNRVVLYPDGVFKVYSLRQSSWIDLSQMSWVVDSFEMANEVVIPASKEGTELGLLNQFRPYSEHGHAYRRPMFTLTEDDGVTVLSGVATAPDVQDTMAILPDKARPDSILMFMVHGDEHTDAVIEVRPDGVIRYRESLFRPSQIAYLSLDGIVFQNKNFKGSSGFIALENSFENVGHGHSQARWFKTKSDTVILSGYVRDAWSRSNFAWSGGQTLQCSFATLPPDLRPDGHVMFPQPYGRGTTRMDVYVDGRIYLVAPNWLPNAGTVSFDGMSYRTKSPYRSEMVVWNSMVNYGGAWRGFTYTRVGDLCMLSGLLRPSGGRWWMVMAMVPPECRPNERLTFLVAGWPNDQYYRVDLLPDGRVLWSDVRSCSYVCLDGMRYIVPTKRAGTMRASLSSKPFSKVAALPMANPWKAAPGYPAASYAIIGKLCMLSGLLLTTDTSGRMVTLPEDCRPARPTVMSFHILSADLRSDSTNRFDLNAAGSIDYVAGHQREGTTPLDGHILPTSTSPLTPLPLEGLWVHFGKGYQEPAFVKQGNLCVMTGYARHGSAQKLEVGWDIRFSLMPPECRVPASDTQPRVAVSAGYGSYTLRMDLSREIMEMYIYWANTNWSVMKSNLVAISGSWPVRAEEKLSYQQGWCRVGGDWREPAYNLEEGLCTLSGTAHHCNGGFDIVVLLPAECRPREPLAFDTQDLYTARRVMVNPAGVVSVRHIGQPYVSLDGISFRVSTDPDPATREA